MIYPQMTCFNLLIHSFALLIFLCSAARAQDPVLDQNGNNLTVGVPYYIALGQYPPGVITLTNRTGSTPCPLNVVQKVWNLPFPPKPTPLPITFHPAENSDNLVRVSTVLNIRFEVDTACPELTVWQVRLTGPASERNFITTGGEIGNPGCETVENWFKIEPVDAASGVYKLVYSPEVCQSDEDSDVIAVDENGQSRLYVNFGGAKLRANLMTVEFLKASLQQLSQAQ